MRDFCGFMFNGRHSSEFNIVRTSTSKRYQDDLTSGTNDTTIQINGRDGKLFLGSNYKERTFSVNFAFDNLTEQKLRDMRQWLRGEDMGGLIFDEEPYKEYTAKVQGKVQLKYLCFNGQKNKEDDPVPRVYKGDGSITFICYYPFAHTPRNVPSIYGEGDGRLIDSYSKCNNKSEWKVASGITNALNNPGDIPTDFILDGAGPNGPYQIKQGNQLEVTLGNTVDTIEIINTITFNESIKADKFYWNSRTGIVKCGDKIVKVSGNTLFKLPVTKKGIYIKLKYLDGTGKNIEESLTGCLSYQYLYY